MESNKLEKYKGIVVSIQVKRRFGFILQEDGTQMFFHATGVCNPEFSDLREGYEVEYMVIDTPKGQKAIGVEMTL